MKEIFIIMPLCTLNVKGRIIIRRAFVNARIRDNEYYSTYDEAKNQMDKMPSGVYQIEKFFLKDESSESLSPNEKKHSEPLYFLNKAKEAVENKKWEIEQTDRYYYASGRNYWTYKEVTYWYHTETTERKETTREITISTGEEHKLPDWAEGITTRRKSLESVF